MTLKDLKHIVFQVTNRRVEHQPKTDEYVAARKIYYVLARDFTTHTFADIGKAVNRQHATVLHGIKTFPYTVANDDRYREWYLDCRSMVEQFVPKKQTSADVITMMKNENRQLRRDMARMKELSQREEKLLSLFNKLPDRLQEDVMFKVETAYKINQKQNRDLAVIYTEA